MEDRDFSGMEYDPTNGIGIPFVTIYPKLTKFRVLMERPIVELEVKSKKSKLVDTDWDMLIRYSLLFSVKEGNPISYISDWDERKALCLQVLGIDKKYPIVLTVIDMNHFLLAGLIRFWLQLAMNDTYTMWFTLRTQFHNYNQFLRQPINMDTTSTSVNTAMKLLPDLKKEIDKLESQLFIDSQIRKMVNEEEIAYFYAEKFAVDWT